MICIFFMSGVFHVTSFYVHQCYKICKSCFCGWIISYCVDIPHFIYMFIGRYFFLLSFCSSSFLELYPAQYMWKTITFKPPTIDTERAINWYKKPSLVPCHLPESPFPGLWHPLYAWVQSIPECDCPVCTCGVQSSLHCLFCSIWCVSLPFPSPRFLETRKCDVVSVSYLKWDFPRAINICTSSVEGKTDSSQSGVLAYACSPRT